MKRAHLPQGVVPGHSSRMHLSLWSLFERNNLQMFVEKYHKAYFNKTEAHPSFPLEMVRYLLMESLSKNVVCEIFNFRGEVNRVSNFNIFLVNIVMGVEPQNVVGLTNRPEDFKDLRRNQQPFSPTKQLFNRFKDSYKKFGK